MWPAQKRFLGITNTQTRCHTIHIEWSKWKNPHHRCHFPEMINSLKSPSKFWILYSIKLSFRIDSSTSNICTRLWKHLPLNLSFQVIATISSPETFFLRRSFVCRLEQSNLRKDDGSLANQFLKNDANEAHAARLSSRQKRKPSCKVFCSLALSMTLEKFNPWKCTLAKRLFCLTLSHNSSCRVWLLPSLSCKGLKWTLSWVSGE